MPAYVFLVANVTSTGKKSSARLPLTENSMLPSLLFTSMTGTLHSSADFLLLDNYSRIDAMRQCIQTRRICRNHPRFRSWECLNWEEEGYECGHRVAQGIHLEAQSRY
jgi:hypothetical protein